MKGLIISSGYINDYSLLKRVVEEHDYIICADGGFDHLINIEKIPNIIIGDLDSVSIDGIKFIKENNLEILKYPSIKDKTDTELAILHGIEKGITNLSLMGVTGSRMDHTMANIFLLRELKHKNINARIIDDKNTIYYVDEYMEIKKRKDTYISIIPITIDGISVSLEGFFYPLNKKFIEFGSTLGISNKIIDDYGNIIIHKGEAIIMESKD